MMERDRPAPSRPRHPTRFGPVRHPRDAPAPQPVPRNKAARLLRRALVRSSLPLTGTGTLLVDFEVLDAEPFDVRPGQFVAVDYEDPVLGYRRSPYCLYGVSTSERTFTLLVRVVPQGPVSVFLGDLVPGDVVSFRGPSGHSMIPREDRTHLVLVATGVGLGPCRLLLRWLADHQPDRRATLYWGLRLEDDVCLLDELILLGRELTRFDWYLSLSQPPSTWPGLRGRVTHSVPPLLATLADKHFYLTCNGAMVAQMSAALREVGVPTARIYEESFFDHRHKPASAEVAAVVERFVATDLMSPLTHLETAMRERRELRERDT